MEQEEKLVQCDGCGKMVPDYNIDRWGDCGACRAASRATDMCVGDIKDK